MNTKPTPTADKLITLICHCLHVRREYIKTDTTFKELGCTEGQKEHMMRYIANRFMMATEGERRKYNLADHTGKYVSDSWGNTMKRIKTVWNALQFIESNDACDGKPAAYKI